jgi:hypothetical protein
VFDYETLALIEFSVIHEGYRGHCEEAQSTRQSRKLFTGTGAALLDWYAITGQLISPPLQLPGIVANMKSSISSSSQPCRVAIQDLTDNLDCLAALARTTQSCSALPQLYKKEIW